MFQFFLWIIHIEDTMIFWHGKLCIKSWYSSKSLWILIIFLPNFWGQIALILPSPKIPQAAKCPNTPVLHTTDMFYADAEPKEDFVILAKTNFWQQACLSKTSLDFFIAENL